MQNIEDEVISSKMGLDDREISDWRMSHDMMLLYSKYDSESKLRDDWAEFDEMPRDDQIQSDWKSLDLFGLTNVDRYHQMLSDFLKNDIVDDLTVKVYAPIVKESVVLESYRKYSSSADIVSAAKTCLKIKEQNTIVSDIVYESAKKEIEDRIELDNLIALSITPYYSPYEMERLGISTLGTGIYSDEPDNTVIGSIDTKQWFQEYKNRFNGFNDETYTSSPIWVETMRKLYSDYDDIKESGDINTINSRKQSMLDLGWNPEIQFNESTRRFARNRINNILEEQYSNYRIIDVTESVSCMNEGVLDPDEEAEQIKVKPIYIVFFNAKNAFNKIVRIVDKSVYSHVSISFNPSLKTLYSFDAKRGGFHTEYLKEYADDGQTKIMQVFCILVDENRYKKMKNKIHNLGRDKSKFGYSFINLITIPLKINYIDKTKMVCSQFVDSMLKLADMNITQLGSNMISPGFLNKKLKKFKGDIYKVYTGSPKNYNPNKVISFIKSLSSNIIRVESNILSPLLSLSLIKEDKEFPIQFTDDGDLLISKGKDIDFEGEYSRCHIALVEYDKAGNTEGMKYCVCKLWYLNIILEEKIHDDRTDKKKLQGYHKARAKILNDIKTYMHKIQKVDKEFDILKEYQSSPFSDDNIKIRHSTLLYTIDLFKKLIGIKK